MRLVLATAVYCVALAASAADAGALPTIVAPRAAHASVLDGVVGLPAGAYPGAPAPTLLNEAQPAPLTAAALSPGHVVIPVTEQLGLTLGPSIAPANGYSLSSGCLAGSWSSARGGCTNLMPWLPDSSVAGVSGGVVIARPGSAYSVSLSASQLAPAERGVLPAVSGAPIGSPVVVASQNVRGQEYSLAATGVWSFERLGALSVTGSVGEALLRSPLSPQNDLDRNQATLALALSRGAFSGGVVGRVVSDNNPSGSSSANWSGLDVGMSWRTPWRGELSFGARNLITAGDEPLLPDPGIAQRDDRRERTPYIEYRQDF